MRDIYKIECYSDKGVDSVVEVCQDNALVEGHAIVTAHVFTESEALSIQEYVSTITDSLTILDVTLYLEQNQ